MRSRIMIVGMVAILTIFLAAFSGGLMADEQGSGSKGCSHESKVEGKCGNEEMCKKMKEHKAAMSDAAEKMAEHLDAMKEISSDEEWRLEMEKHMGMLQNYLEVMMNCPMEDMMHSMMSAKGHGMGSGTK